jgi:ribosomal protein L11 methyltransferase
MLPAWIEISVLAPVEWHELIADAFALGPCTSVAFGRASLATPEPPAGWDWVRTFVIESDDGPELRARVAGRIADLAASTGADELSGLELRFRRLPPEDYANSWRKSWKAVRIGAFAITPYDWKGALRAHDQQLFLEPGGAFGTGRHATTRACLRAVSEELRPGQRVLDAGTGSGVLCVAAALRGAAQAIGFDIDPNAIPYALDLAQRNRVAQRCEFRVGGFECLGEGEREFDGVLANIFADLIAAHAADMAGRLRRGGWFAFSGCVMHKRETTLAAIAAAGLRVEAVHTRGRWDTYRGVRPK